MVIRFKKRRESGRGIPKSGSFGFRSAIEETVKSKTLTRRRRRSEMKSTFATHLQAQLGIPLQKYQQQPSSASSSNPSSRFQSILESVATDAPNSSSEIPDVDLDDKDFILSQDFFCTPDYITPDNQNLLNSFDGNKENVQCPESPEKLNTVKSKKRRQDGISDNPFSPSLDQLLMLDIGTDAFGPNETKTEQKFVESRKSKSYVTQSAVALRCRVMPPPCIQNPYLAEASEAVVDPFGNQRVKCADIFSSVAGGGDGLSRYHTDFHELQQIGAGNFSRVFKALRRIDGCLYAVKLSTRQLHQDALRRKALMEVQALAALGCHENIVGYYSSWFENEQLYIQMELCDCSLSIKNLQKRLTEAEVLSVLHQIAKALQYIHDRGVAHLDVKPDNIYAKNGIFKLGDFGCASRLDQSLPIEEGDARYMPQEILNENYDHLDKVDIFSLGASIYELIRAAPLPESGSLFLNLKEGKLPLLPGHSLQFQSLLKAMVDPDPDRRPCARDLVENPIFGKAQKCLRS
ncbi:Wee1-like protein kinase [Linum perenne]